MFCSSCGVESTNKTRYCKSCGANLVPPENPVQVHIPRPPLGWMTLLITVFSFVGLMASVFALMEFNQHRGEFHNHDVLGVFFGCLAFVFLIAGGLVWQLGRLVSAYREAVKTAREKGEPASPPQPAPAPKPLQMPAAQEPVSSVTEHTTRTFSPSPEK
ncbi:MAG TPA: hypothetical protein VJ302_33410 [Blastocatellia bacterium]|nr:hypothetical protein [Blastocatellia bacterium]